MGQGRRSYAGFLRSALSAFRGHVRQEQPAEAPEGTGATVRALIDSLPAHIALLDHEGTVIEVNEHWRRFGIDNRSPDARVGVGSNYLEVCRRAGNDQDAVIAGEVAEGIEAILAGERVSCSREYPCHGPTERRWFRLMAHRLDAAEMPSGKAGGAVVMHLDITERRLAEDTLERIAYQDPVTGLWNRQGFVGAFERWVGHTGWDRSALLVALNIQGMRNVNDAHGYEVGDRLLARIGRRLQERTGGSGLVARTGGDEFAVYLPTQEGRSEEEQRALLQTTFEGPFEVSRYEIECTARFGYTTLGDHTRPVEKLLREAQVALGELAHDGTGQWCAYTTTLDRRVRHRIALTSDLRRAVHRQEFELHYQPKVSLATGRLMAAEALLRWNHPRHGLRSPGAFIPVAEQSQLIVPMGEWALHEACRHLRGWLDHGLPVVRTAVNVSMVQLQVGDFTDTVRDALRTHGVEPHRLTLEITESVFEHESGFLREQLEELHRVGVELALDDFGTGYSSLRYLQRYPFNEIKIDRAFINKLPEDSYSRTIVSAVLTITEALGARAVAEGVEDAESARTLLGMGYETAQGFFYSVPLQAEDFRWLLEQNLPLPLHLDTPADHERIDSTAS